LTSTAKTNGSAEREYMKRIWKIICPLSLVVSFLLVSSVAFARPPADVAVPIGADPFINVTAATCTIAGWLKGPVGIAVGFLVLVGGLIAMQVANRDAIPMVTRAVIGTVLLIGAGAAFTAIVSQQACQAA
jgi:hypothetical protein